MIPVIRKMRTETKMNPESEMDLVMREFHHVREKSVIFVDLKETVTETLEAPLGMIVMVHEDQEMILEVHQETGIVMISEARPEIEIGMTLGVHQETVTLEIEGHLGMTGAQEMIVDHHQEMTGEVEGLMTDQDLEVIAGDLDQEMVPETEMALETAGETGVMIGDLPIEMIGEEGKGDPQEMVHQDAMQVVGETETEMSLGEVGIEKRVDHGEEEDLCQTGMTEEEALIKMTDGAILEMIEIGEVPHVMITEDPGLKGMVELGEEVS